MAEQKIQFSIGSDFKGEGFVRAKAAVSQLSKQTKDVGRAFSDATGIFGGMSNVLGGVVSKVGGLLGVLGKLSPQMIAITAAGKALEFCFEKVSEKTKESEERLEALRKKMAEVKAQMADSGFKAEWLKTLQNELQKTSKEFEVATKTANTFRLLSEKLSAAKSGNEISKMELGKAGMSNLDSASVDTQIGMKKLDNARQMAALKIENAAKSVSDAEDDLNLTREAMKKLQQEEKRLADQYEAAYGDQALAANTLRDLTTVRKALKDMKTDEASKLDQLKVAIENEKIARLDSATAVNAAENAANKAAEAEMKLITEIEKRAEEEANAAEQARQDADAERSDAEAKVRNAEFVKKLNDLIESSLDTTKSVEDAQQKLADMLLDYSDQIGSGEGFAQLENATKKLAAKLQSQIEKAGKGNDSVAAKKYEAALANFNKDLNANLYNDALNKFYGDNNKFGLDRFNAYGDSGKIGVRNSGYNPMKIAGQIAVDAGIKSGSIRNMKDVGRAQRDAERAYRDYASSPEARREAQDAKRLADLTKKEDSGRKLSKREQEEKEKLGQLKDAKDKARKDLDEAEKAKNEEAQNVQKMKETLDEIKKKMENLGLK